MKILFILHPGHGRSHLSPNPPLSYSSARASGHWAWQRGAEGNSISHLHNLNSLATAALLGGLFLFWKGPSPLSRRVSRKVRFLMIGNIIDSLAESNGRLTAIQSSVCGIRVCPGGEDSASLDRPVFLSAAFHGEATHSLCLLGLRVNHRGLSAS